MLLRALIAGSLLFGLLASTANAGPLEDYVAKPDASYDWFVRSRGEVAETPYVELVLTSQTWKTGPWKHLLYIIKPLTLASDANHALMLIDGGAWRDELEDPGTPINISQYAGELAVIANTLGIPVAVLKQVPNQPLFGDLGEDRLIAYTFERFMQTGDFEWPALLPMVKSAVRGMDTIQAYAEENWDLDIQTFTLTGASKRGWTTWLTGAVDVRVEAIMPIVIDILNMDAQIDHQREVWGETSPEISEYEEVGLFEQFDTLRGQQLLRIVDPFRYRRAYDDVEKLIVVGTNDAYWPVDAANLYRPGLPDPTGLIYIPGAGHDVPNQGLNIARIVSGLHALTSAARGRIDLAELDWQFRCDGDEVEIEVEPDRRAVTAAAWVARSPTRDFRGATWDEQGLDTLPWEDGFQLPFQNEVKFRVDAPTSGYLALFAELVFADQNVVPYPVATPVQVIGPGCQLLDPTANLTP